MTWLFLVIKRPFLAADVPLHICLERGKKTNKKMMKVFLFNLLTKKKNASFPLTFSLQAAFLADNKTFHL